MEINAKTMEKMAEIITKDEMDKIGKLIQSFESDEDFGIDVDTAHESIYVAGRYLKFSRSLPQTPWIMNGEVSLGCSRIFPILLMTIFYIPDWFTYSPVHVTFSVKSLKRSETYANSPRFH